MLDDARTDLFVTAELDAGRVVGAPAGQPGEQQPVEPDRRGGVQPAEVVHHPRTTVDGDANGPRQRTGQLDSDPGPVGRLPEFADYVAHRRGYLVERQPRRRTAQLRVGRWPTHAVADVLLMHPAVEEPHPHESPVTLGANRGQSRRVPVV